MQQILDIFLFNIWEIIGIAIFLILLGIQLYYYLSYYNKPLTTATKQEAENLNSQSENWKVSVIISSENEVMRLSKNLPIILEQDYPDFEVIVINNGSTDETDDLIESLKLKYNNLYCTFVPYSNDKDFGKRKLAFTLGAKAAKGDVLLFTEPHSKPLSKDWISSMTRGIDENIEVVVGASYFTHEDSFYNRIARFDNHIFTMQYLSKAIMKTPFTGVYSNVAFKKRLFFDKKGFSSYLALENGEDVFINQIVNDKNTLACLESNSFTEVAVDSYSLWKRIKSNYSLAKTYFKDKSAQFFSIEVVSRILFYAAFIGGVAYAITYQSWGILIIALLVFIIRFTIQFVVINKATKYFGSGKFCFSLIVVDVLQPFYSLSFRTRKKRIKGLK